MSAVLVTGGAGYIGSHACKALARAGYTPVTYDNLERGHRWAVKWGPLEVGDLADGARLDEVIRAHRPVAVLHFAGYIVTSESVGDPVAYWRNNVAASVVLIEAMRRGGVANLVYSSSAAVYGRPERVPIDEAHPLSPLNPYGRTKLAVEQMLGDLAGGGVLRSVSLRYFNGAGADPDGEIGEAHAPETHLIPCVLDVALGRRSRIEVLGDDYDTPDGTCIRDYVHVSDLADAHVLALRRLLDGGDTRFLNLGNGQGYSVRQVIEAARRVTGHAIPAVAAPRRPGDPPALVADAGAARAVLGWAPRRAALEMQVGDAWRWHRQNSARRRQV